MTGEECIFPIQSNGADGSFDGVAVHLDAPVCQEQAEAIPVFGNVFERLAERRLDETLARLAVSQAPKAAINGAERSCLAARRASALKPWMSFSIR